MSEVALELLLLLFKFRKVFHMDRYAYIFFYTEMKVRYFQKEGIQMIQVSIQTVVRNYNILSSLLNDTVKLEICILNLTHPSPLHPHPHAPPLTPQKNYPCKLYVN